MEIETTKTVGASPPVSDSFAALISRGKQKAPFKCLLYGNAGVGKSTLASQAEVPLFLNIEDGVKQIDCAATPRINNYVEFKKWLVYVANEKHEFKTIVVDTIDVLEVLYFEHICKSEGKQNIEDFAYGAGYKRATAMWKELLRWCDALVGKGINVILIAHEQVTRYDNPMHNGYDRYSIKINKNSSNIIVAAMDCVLFAHWQLVLTDNNNATKQLARGTGKRALQCQETPAVVAKNRYNLKPIDAMDASIWAKLV